MTIKRANTSRHSYWRLNSSATTAIIKIKWFNQKLAWHKTTFLISNSSSSTVVPTNNSNTHPHLRIRRAITHSWRTLRAAARMTSTIALMDAARQIWAGPIQMTLVASYYKCRRRPPRAFTEVETVIINNSNSSATTKTTSLWTFSQGEGTPKSILNRNENLQLWNEKDISCQTRSSKTCRQKEWNEWLWTGSSAWKRPSIPLSISNLFWVKMDWL